MQSKEKKNPSLEVAENKKQKDVSEKDKLWRILKSRKTYGLAFRRNEKVGKYLVDFCCHSEKIAVEISDFPFENAKQMDKTMERHLYLIEMGYTILGFDVKTICNKPQYIREMIKTHVQINHTGNMESFDLDFGL